MNIKKAAGEPTPGYSEEVKMFLSLTDDIIQALKVALNLL